MELSERKVKILQAIIRNYLETGEPVGSRTISKYTDLNLSSATIRNEMSDLEEMGYILQPHTSAGRIPSDKGYRLYVAEGRQDGSASEAGSEASCRKYQLCFHDHDPYYSYEQAEIYPAVESGCESASCRCGS